MRDPIELNNLFAVKATICSNAETLLDGRDVEAAAATTEEIVGDAMTAGNRVIFDRLGGFAETDSFFPNWHGGKFCQADVICGHCVANVYSRESADEEWDWSGWSSLPNELQTKIVDALEAAEAAMDASLDRWEKYAAAAIDQAGTR